ncbi:MAG: BfmA/BtgA family mobilization protein [Desulfurococcaceae archaeon]
MTTIKVSVETKKRLDKLKVHPREPYEDVIKRLLEFYEKHSTKQGP